MERDSRDAPLGKKKVQGSTSQRILVRVTSVRKRLIDEDNLCEKPCILCDLSYDHFECERNLLMLTTL